MNHMEVVIIFAIIVAVIIVLFGVFSFVPLAMHQAMRRRAV